MKLFSLTFATFSSLCLATAASAQVVTQVGGETTGSTLPGSPSDYIIFDGSDYNQVGSNGAGTYKNLPDFNIVGGEFDYAGDAGSSTINTPGGVASLRTGGITSTNTIAVGIELLGTISPAGVASDGFNFNDFNIYVMVDNAQTGVGYTPQGVYDDTSVGLDARLDEVEMTQVDATLTSQTPV
jgi:hypothetical protein